MTELGPLDDFDTPDEDDAPRLEGLARRPRRYERAEPPVLPHGMRPFTLPHDFVSEACTHRLHGDCTQRCSYCDVGCLCVCHRWLVPVESM